MRVVVTNLAEIAIRYAGPGAVHSVGRGRLEWRCRADRRVTMGWGSRTPSPRLFERFYAPIGARLARHWARLAIVKHVTQAGGTVEAWGSRQRARDSLHLRRYRLAVSPDPHHILPAGIPVLAGRRGTGGMTPRLLLACLHALRCGRRWAAVGTTSGGRDHHCRRIEHRRPFTTKAAEDWKADGAATLPWASPARAAVERFSRGETDISNASRRIDEDEAGLQERTASSMSSSRSRRMRSEHRQPRERLGLVPDRRATQGDLEAGLEGVELEPGRPVLPEWRSSFTARAPTPGRSTTSPASSTARRREPHGPLGDRGRQRHVQGVSGDEGALGYFGFSYYEENQDKLKALEVDGGGGLCGSERRDGAETTRTRRSHGRSSCM